MKAILHIGFPKTGTTTIQEHLIGNRSALLTQGFYVPDIDHLGIFTDLELENAGHASLFLAASDPKANDWLFNYITILLQLPLEELTRETLLGRWNRMVDQINAHTNEANTTILSSELLSLCLEEQIASVHELMARSFDEVKVVVYLRRQMESLISWYSEIHKAGGYFPTFETLLAEVKRQFEEKISQQSMLEKISYTVGSGYSFAVRIVPLPLKNIGLRMIYEQGAKTSTLGFSNVGQVKMSEPFQPYVEGAAVLLSTTPR